MMDSFKFSAAVKGDASVLANIAKEGRDKFVAKTPDLENNIVHVAARNGQYKFIEAAIAQFPDLLQQKNKKGNTPLHEAAELGNKVTINLLVSHLKISTSSDKSTDDMPTYMEKNNTGDTPFHVALRYRNLAAADELFSIVVTDHPKILAIQNQSRETPLHLYIRFCAGGIFSRNLELDDKQNNEANKQKLIARMMKTYASAVFIPDSDGFTPLMRAAEYGRVLAALRMVIVLPQLSEYRDQKGRSFLHNLRLRITDLNARDRDSTIWACDEILRMTEIHTLIFSQDQDGNTPLHLAIADGDFDVAQLILQRCVKDASIERRKLVVSLKNNKGNTILDLVTSVSGIPANLKKLMEQVAMEGVMDTELYKAAIAGTTKLFERPRTKSAAADDYFLCQTHDGSNILHIALLHGHQLFIKEALEWLSTLIFQKDCSGNTPLHVAARIKTTTALEFLKLSLTTWSEMNGRSLFSLPPWLVKNSKGNTFLHEAASNSNYEALHFVANHRTVNRDETFLNVNDSGETVLHMVARYANYAEISKTVLLDLVAPSKNALDMHDVDGLTPILRAAQCGQLQLVTKLCFYHPSLIHSCDYEGRTVLHLVRTWALKLVDNSNAVLNFWKDISNVCSGVDGLLFSQDHDGNTPLHLAIIVRDFEIAHFLIKWCTEKTSNIPKELMNIKNNDGKSVVDLVIYGSDIPANLIKLIGWTPMGTTMDGQLYEAAKKGETHLLQQRRSQMGMGKEIEAAYGNTTYNDDYFCCQADDGSNIIHIALRHGHKLFIDIALESYFDLVYQKDFNGDTPLHVAARLHTPAAFEFLESSLTMWDKKGVEHIGSLLHLQLWTITNSNGNTFFHEAARTSNYKVISLVLTCQVTREAMSYTNYNGETSLHLIARYATYATMDTLDETVHAWICASNHCLYMRDKDGFTPVLRAVQCGRLRMAFYIVSQYRRSVEICDHKSRTVLHYLKAQAIDLVDDSEDILALLKNFIELPEVNALRIAQDEDGNTPLHLAIINGDVATANFLMNFCLDTKQELNIVNNSGHSIFDLLSSEPHTSIMSELKDWMKRSYIKERQLVDQKMEDELYQAAIKCDVEIFKQVKAKDERDVESGDLSKDEAHFCSRTPDGSTIIHIALRHGNPKAEKFIKKALESFPVLILEVDNNGDTLFHLAAKWKSDISVSLLANAWEDCLKAWKKRNKGIYNAPWEVKNHEGNYPIHEALQTDNLIVAQALLDYDGAASRVNNLGETPLHVYAKYGFSVNEKAKEFVDNLIKKTISAAYIRDIEGFTPLLRAAKSGRFHVARAILKNCPQSAYLRDPNGKTFLHLLRFTGEDVDESLIDTFKQTADQLFKLSEADAQRLVQDNEGNTPLHCAIKTKNSIAAIVLTRGCLKSKARAELDLVNKEGETISDLLASHDVPNKIIEQIRKKVPEAAYLARSSYGIRKEEMKESANALSVVAGLLATITFAAGIQVPGGFNDDGYSVLLIKPVFQAFLVFNTFAMCGSMLVLFYLLWVMGIGKIHGSLMVLDLSINLLRASFYSTLVAFTTGVYVTTANKSLWLAIFISVICFLTFLITFKFSVRRLLKFGKWASRNTKSIVKSISGCLEPVDANKAEDDVPVPSTET